MDVKPGNLTLKHRTRQFREPARLAVELVEPGDLDSWEQPEQVTKQLPPGITSKMLYVEIH